MAKWTRAENAELVDLQGLTDELKLYTDNVFTDKFYQLESVQNTKIKNLESSFQEYVQSFRSLKDSNARAHAELIRDSYKLSDQIDQRLNYANKRLRALEMTTTLLSVVAALAALVSFIRSF